PDKRPIRPWLEGQLPFLGLKDHAEVVKVSKATPHMFRHTFVRDHYLKGTPIEDIADLLGDDVATVREYYSTFDELRKQRLIARTKTVFADDPITLRLAGAEPKTGGRTLALLVR
ncbi:MAG: hypothetical protein NTV52_00695, partial [Acidobacteria bacterium]|nr:hypothetical protein [Acidobacteriota bacterium]